MDTESKLLTNLYKPIPEGSKRIRVISILPLERDLDQPLDSCTLDEVDLEDWTPEYRSFRDRLPVYMEDFRSVQGRVRHDDCG